MADAITHPVAEGTHVRLLEPSVGGDHFDAHPVGTVVIIEEYISSEDSETDDGKAFYWASTPGSANNAILHEGTFEVEMTAEQADARTVPSRAELRDQVQSALHSGWGDVEIIETGPGDTDSDLEVYGRCANGLHVTFLVTISKIGRADP